MIDMKNIVANPLQPRQDFDRKKLQELANSIKEGELLQPIVVRKYNGQYEIVAGERRFKAFQILKEPKIPAIIREIKDDTEALEKSLIENLQRDDLTSVERENAIMDLWNSKKYNKHKDLAKKLGTNETLITRSISAKEFRDKEKISMEISSRTIASTTPLDSEVRKKLIKDVETKKIKTSELDEVVSKIKGFPKPEQQLEILEEFEQQDDMSREIFDDIVKKKKEIVDGGREPEHIIKIETDSDKRMIQEYIDIKNSVHDICSDHIKHFKTEENKKEAVGIIQEIVKYLNVQLDELGYNVVVLDERKKKETD